MAGNEVKIILTAVDKASAVLNKAGGNIKKHGADWNNAFNVISVGALAAGTAVVGFVAKTIDSTIKYADQVRELSRLIGASAEESSKLIQAADDVFVSYEELTAGMRVAIRKGIEPSIDGMGKLADQYLAIQDPIARSKFLMDTFGRAGAKLAPLLEKGSEGIKELGENAEKAGLVLDRKALAATLRYKESLDELNDSWAGFSLVVGLQVIPKLTAFIKLMNDFVNSHTFENAADASRNFLETFFNIDMSRSPFAQLGYELEEFENAVDPATKALQRNREAAAGLQIPYEELVITTMDLGYAGDKVRDSFNDAAESAGRMRDKSRDMIDGLDRQIASPIADFIADLKWYEAGGWKIQMMFETIKEQWKAGKITTPEAEEMLAGLFVVAKDVEVELKLTNVNDAALEIQEVLGGSFKDAKEMITGTEGVQGALDALTADAAALEMLEKFNTTLSDVRDQIDGGGESVQSSLDDVDATGAGQNITRTLGRSIQSASDLVRGGPSSLYDRLEELTEKNWIIRIKIQTQGAIPTPHQHGGPVAAGMPYIVGEAGPELFIPRQGGKIVPNNRLTGSGGGKQMGGGITIEDINIFGGAGQDEEIIARRVVERLSAAAAYNRRSSINYAG